MLNLYFLELKLFVNKKVPIFLVFIRRTSICYTLNNF